MKILELKIFNAEGIQVQCIPFQESGLTVIFGDVTQNMDKKSTSNSLGKSILLKMIDYIFGANKDTKVIKKELTGFKISAQVKFKSKTYKVERIFSEPKGSNSDQIFIDDKEYSLDNYKQFFPIERMYFSPQILLDQKINEIYSQGKSVTKTEYAVFLEALSLITLSDIAKEIAAKQAELDLNKKLVKQLSPEINITERKNNILKNKQRRTQELENITLKLESIKNKVGTLQTADITQEMVIEREKALNTIKTLEHKIQLDQIELDNLKNFIQEFENDVIIHTMFQSANQIIPDMIKKRLDEVYSFNQAIFSDRKNALFLKKEELEEQISNNKNIVNANSLNANDLGQIISQNQSYQEALEIYKKYSQDFNEITLDHEKANSTDKIIDEIIFLTREIKEHLFIEARNINESDKYKNIKDKYFVFVKDFVEKLYEDKGISTFDILVRRPSETARCS